MPKAIIQQLEKHLKNGSLTREKALSVVADKDPDTASELRDIIEMCDHFRYGFGDAALDTEGLLAQADELLRAVSQNG